MIETLLQVGGTAGIDVNMCIHTLYRFSSHMLMPRTFSVNRTVLMLEWHNADN